jgi:hypothetical protein
MTLSIRSLCATLGALVLLVVMALPALADDAGRERRDARRFRELQTELREASEREESILAEAVDQARDDAGRAQPSTLAELTNVMDEKDRILHHLRELALRNGWSVPDPDAEKATGPVRGGPLGRMVSRATAAVRAALAEEARAIAARLELPLIPLPPPTTTASAAEGAGDDR